MIGYYNRWFHTCQGDMSGNKTDYPSSGRVDHNTESLFTVSFSITNRSVCHCGSMIANRVKYIISILIPAKNFGMIG